MVWMRVAALSQFKKLHRIIPSSAGLKAGDTLEFTILNKFDINSFGGEKYILISTTSWLGGKNIFLGWAYIVVAICAFLLAAGVGINQCVHFRPPGDLRHWKDRPADPSQRAPPPLPHVSSGTLPPSTGSTVQLTLPSTTVGVHTTVSSPTR